MVLNRIGPNSGRQDERIGQDEFVHHGHDELNLPSI